MSPGRPAGLYLRYGDALDEARNAELQAHAAALLSDPPEGLTDVIPGYASLYLEYDAARLGPAELRRWAADATDRAAVPTGREVELPVAYDGADLAEVARRTGLAPAEVVRRHAGRSYRVFAMGFLPGFAFLGPLDEALRLPRRGEPRARVPAHAVAIAGAQTGVYPLASPGGWHLLGHALEALYDPRRPAPFRLAPGDRVRFRPAEGPPPPEPAPLELLPAAPERPALAVLEPGLLDLVVDAGRVRVGRFGLARSGPADAVAAGVANRLLGNPAGATLVELTLTGPLLEALADGVVAVAGDALAPRLDGRELEPWRSFAVRRGQRLSFRPTGRGARAYLALAGGVASARFLGSASTDLRGRIGRPLRAGDVLGAAAPAAPRPGRAFRPHRPAAEPVPLRLWPGPQPDPAAFASLLRRPYRVAAADRAGLRLDGPALPGGDVLSEAVPLGALQVTADGRPLLLLCDRGTLGGYRKPALLDPRDLARAGQLRAGDRVRFVAAAL